MILTYVFTECVYETGKFGLYANSSEEYWTQINGYKLSDLVYFIDAWNGASSTWNRIYGTDYGIKNYSQLFRLLFYCINNIRKS